MGAVADAVVRYEPGGNNRVLKHILRLVWESRCYWCRNYKEYSALEIDHILAQNSNDAERARLKQAFNLSDDYDVHGVYNLAPICSDCNKTKGSVDLTQVPVVLNRLKEAQRHAKAISSRVRSFRNSSELGGALLLAVEADLEDPGNRATFEEGAPAVVQRLSELAEGKADFYVSRTADVWAQEKTHTVRLRLNERGRAAVTVLESVAGGTLHDALSAPLSDLLDRVADAAGGAFLDHDEGMGVPDVGSVSLEWPTVAIDTVDFLSTPPANVEIEFAGEFEAMATGSVARSSADGSELEYVQGDASVSGRFSFILVWGPDDPVGQFYFDQAWLDAFAADTWLDGRRSVVWDGLFDEGEAREAEPGDTSPEGDA
ncbi:HNH endonuclease [Micromonospora zamorensis]|uniref:HNH endonuclease n=1 Tax=Micromonospora zamorensis TaxID=709883 RepID=UPI002E1D7244